MVGTTALIYAPVSGVGATSSPDPVDEALATLAYNFKETTAVNALLASANYDKPTGITSIPNTNENAVKVQVYIYFEGEDLNCKSTNISGITVSDLSVAVKFGITTTH